jgi:glutathione S-transferase
VQRAAIVLAEKGVRFERRTVDLADKPAWFLAISPLGKTPVLQVGDQAIFESAVICEYLDETTLPALHPADPLARARHRGWIEFGSQVLNAIAALYNAPDEDSLRAESERLRKMLSRVEAELGRGPFFAGPVFSMVDAVFAPVLRYFDVLERLDVDALRGLPRLAAWREALAARPSVRAAVGADYPDLLLDFIVGRRSALSTRAVEAGAGAPAR